MTFPYCGAVNFFAIAVECMSERVSWRSCQSQEQSEVFQEPFEKFAPNFQAKKMGKIDKRGLRTWPKHTIGNDITLLLESFNKVSIDGAVAAFLAEHACGELKSGYLEKKWWHFSNFYN